MSTKEECPDNGNMPKKTYKYAFVFDGPVATIGRVEYGSGAELVKHINRAKSWRYDVDDETGMNMGFWGWLLKNCMITIRDDSTHKEEFIQIDDVAKSDLGECYPDEKSAGVKHFFYCTRASLYYSFSIELDEPFDPTKLVIGCRWYVDPEGCVNQMANWESVLYDGKKIISDDNEIYREDGTTGYCEAWILEDGVRTRVCGGCERDNLRDGEDEEDEEGMISIEDFFGRKKEGE